MRAEDWKSFKAGGYKLFKEGHVQNIMITQHDSVLGITCSCLPEMKKDGVYKIKINLSTNSCVVALLGEAHLEVANILQQHCLLWKISIYSTGGNTG